MKSTNKYEADGDERRVRMEWTWIFKEVSHCCYLWNFYFYSKTNIGTWHCHIFSFYFGTDYVFIIGKDVMVSMKSHYPLSHRMLQI